MAASKWDEVLDNLTESFKSRLSGVDRQNFASFCVDNKHIRNTVCKYLQGFKKTNLKSNTLCRKYFKQGRKLRNENIQECLSLYNSSIAYATKDDPDLPDIYNCRSLVLDQLGHTSESLRDIDLAIEAGYSEDSEIILRQAECLVKLGDISKTNVLSKGDCLKMKEELKKLRISNVKSKEKIPILKGGENENFASASKSINVFYNEKKGRHVVANDDIHPGDVLFVEKPFAFVLFKDVCHSCCKNTVAPVFCYECLDVAFCSPQCRDENQKTFHQFECGFGDLFKSIGIAHLSLRIILKASSCLDELKEILHDIKESKYETGMVPYKRLNYEAVYKLVNNINMYEKVDLFQYTVTALLLALYLKNNTSYLSRTSNDEDLKFLTGILLRHILQLICNGHAIVDTFLDVYKKNTVYTETEERIGTAIYPSASMMNHSCQPSIINSFYGNVLVVRAAKEIQKGEEVFNCYGPDSRRMKRCERQEILKKQYFFTCQCQSCSEKYDRQEIFTAFKCPDCKGAFIPEKENSQNWICVACEKISKVSNDVIEKEILFYSLVKEGENIPDVLLRLRTFLKIWRLGREIFYKFHKDLSYAADEVARCLAIMEDFGKCVLFLKCCVLSVEKRFGSLSIELAKEMKKLGDAIMRHSLDCQQTPRELSQEGLSYYRKAERIISLLYGPNHPELDEIKTNSKILSG